MITGQPDLPAVCPSPMSAGRVLPPIPGAAAAVEDHVFLLGRPPIGELLQFVRGMVLDGRERDQGALTQQWRDASDHLQVLQRTEAGTADNSPTLPLAADLALLAESVRADPMFQSAFRFVPTEFAMVELDRLVVFQKFVNLGYVEKLKAFLSERPTQTDIARLAFGLSRPLAPVRVLQNSGNVFTVVSPSSDLRLLEAHIVDPASVHEAHSSGRPVTHIVLTVGFGSNYLNALSVNGRLVLNNGSHRAYALRSLGVTHAPCLVQRVSRVEELELVAGPDLLAKPDLYLTHIRPPLLKDYFDPKLRLVLPVPTKNKMVRLQFGCDQSDVPAT